MKTWADWEGIHQPFELQYHIEQGIAWCSDEAQFRQFWERIFDFVDPEGECLDVGCGPRPPFGLGSTAIEPLASQYRQLVPDWWIGVRAFGMAAETPIPALDKNFNTVLCWNCLDHTIGWKQILANLANYGADNAVYAIATDFNPPSVGHPGFGRAEFFMELDRYFRIVKQEENFQERDVALVLAKGQAKLW